MAASAPRIHPRLVDAIVRLSRSELSFAEINRRVGALADEHGLPRPSYERVRLLVYDARERDLYPSTAEVVLDVAINLRPPRDLGDQLILGAAPSLEVAPLKLTMCRCSVEDWRSGTSCAADAALQHAIRDAAAERDLPAGTGGGRL